MEDSAAISGLVVGAAAHSDRPRHSVLVRVTHWITTLSFCGLMVSGVAILLAHPRLYWGETGAFGGPALIDLPLPLMLTGQSGWGRSLHFLTAWLCVSNGLLYVMSGLLTRHFPRDLWPSNAELTWRAAARTAADHLRVRLPADRQPASYNVLQQLTYLAVIFVLFPLMIWTGLAMSPAITSVFPILVTTLGGQQSARTFHFFGANALLLFLVVHVIMVGRTGFADHLREMTIGTRSGTTEAR
jgi:thiosulfate reductase cytochrome b subunit